jgi:Erv1 / Alr family
MDPTQYGPSTWVTIHALGGLATEEHKRVAYAQWLKLLGEVFPCEICAAHLRQTMKTYPVERFLGSAEDLLRYTYILHDAANNSWSQSHPDQPRKVSPPWEDVKALYLSVPTPEPTPAPVPTLPTPTPLPAPSSTRHAPRSGSRMLVNYPAFQHLKSNFHSTRR